MAAGQIGCQATGNSPGSPDGQSAPGSAPHWRKITFKKKVRERCNPSNDRSRRRGVG